ncbi:MAG: adenylate/guanylate cyclase domain-containing protein [Bdellovibrionota bacterium]
MKESKDFSSTEKVISESLYADTAKRALYLSLICSLLFLTLGITSYDYLHFFNQNITLWSNLWPRLVFNTLPWLLAALYIQKHKHKPKTKIINWTIFHGLIFIVTGFIHVWPIALNGSPESLIYVGATNGAYFFGTWVILAIPKKIIPICLTITILLVWLPLITIAKITGNLIIFKNVLNDTLFLGPAGFGAGFFISKLYEQIARIKAEKQIEAAKFLGTEVYSAIFEDKKELFKEETRTGYVLYIDIRNSTYMTNNFKKEWEAFGREWMAAASDLVPNNRGNLLKTGGDSLLITFGVFDEALPDLSDIPGIERDEISAENQRWKELTYHCFSCTHKLIQKFQELSKLHFPNTPVKLGAGIDRGPIHRGIRGSDRKMELDIWGDRVNCSSRLQDYSKNLLSHFEKDSSVLVVSPFAGDYIEDQTDFKTHLINDSGIKDFPGIKWVLVKEFPYYLRLANDPGVKAA